MQIRLDKERAEPLEWEETVEFPTEHLAPGLLEAIGPVACRGQVHFVPPGFLLRARLSYDQTLACIRCLKPIREASEGEFEVLLMVEPDRAAGGDTPIELEETDLSVLRVEGEEIETEPILIEQILLQVPMKPLCREDCRGLCPRCGSDRNESPDCCDETRYDSRWSGLQSLRDRLPRTTGT